MNSKLKFCLLAVVAIFGIFFTSAGILLHHLVPNMVRETISKKIPLTPSSESLERWSVVTVPIQFSVRPFSVLNGHAVEQYGARPQLEEKGPYVFRQTRRKNVHSYFDNNLRLSYKLIKGFHFEPSLSNGSLDDVLIVPNIPLIGFLTKLRQVKNKLVIGTLLKKFVEKYTERTDTKLFEKRTVSQLLFDGYPIDLLNDIEDFAKRFDIVVPRSVPDNRFGVLYGKNYSESARHDIHTGLGSTPNFTKIIAIDERQSMSVWKNGANPQYCNAINGTDGSQFHPNFQRSERAYIFSEDFCRSLYLVFGQDDEISGIPVFRMTIPREVTDAPRRGTNNECFCVDFDDPICTVGGIFDISPCRKGAPVVLSFPHFLKADPLIGQAVDGLNPSESAHDSVLYVEPMTGAVLKARQRVQINIRIRQDEDFDIVKNVQSGLYIHPVLWIEESASIDVTKADIFKSKLITPLKMSSIAGWSGIILGPLLLLVAFIVCILHLQGQKSAHRSWREEKLKDSWLYEKNATTS